MPALVDTMLLLVVVLLRSAQGWQHAEAEKAEGKAQQPSSQKC
jgi:hypothetical protein